MLKRLVYIGALYCVALFPSSCSNDDEVKEKKNFSGTLSTVKIFGGSDEEVAKAIVQTQDGGAAILGYTKSTDGDVIDKSDNSNDYWIIRLDNKGKQLWNKTIGGSGDDQGQDIIVTVDGGFLVTGYSRSNDGDASLNRGFHDNWFVKLSATGAIQWERSYGFSGHDHSYSIIQTQDGGYFSAGFLDITASQGQGGLSKHGVGEFWGQKLNQDGSLAWRTYFGGSNNDRAYHVLQSYDGGYMLFGATESSDFDITSSNGSYDIWIVKINNKGALVWQKTYGGSGIDIAFDAAYAADNSYVVVGQSISNDGDVTDNKGNSDAWVLRINDRGDVIWKKSFGGPGFELAQGIITTDNQEFFVTGASQSVSGDLTTNAGDNDIWVFQIDLSGTLLWQKSIGGSGYDFGYDILKRENGEVLVVGETHSSNISQNPLKGLSDIILITLQ